MSLDIGKSAVMKMLYISTSVVMIDEMMILKLQMNKVSNFSSVRGEALIYGHPAGCRFISTAHIMVSVI